MKHPARRQIPSVVNLNTFDTIARRGSVTAAADELGLSQGAVSKQLLDLESFLGTTLFERNNARLALSDEGAGYLARIRSLLDQLEAATVAASGAAQRMREVRFSVPNTFGLLWVMPRLCGFAAAHPEIRIHVANHIGAVSLRDAGLDAAIVYAEDGLDDDSADLLHGVRSLPVAARELVRGRLPLQASRIAALPLLHHTTAPSAWASYLRDLDTSIDLPLPPGTQYNLVTFALKAAEAGLGAALVPDYAVADSLREGRVVQLNRASVPSRRGYYLIRRADRADVPAVKVLREWLMTRRADVAGMEG
ncbi:LysR substrate-binding domain-containing protein [Cupriavidus pauculus]|nr:LysR substrate-binding domain-containing protein [Cupriavidus pauculus]